MLGNIGSLEKMRSLKSYALRENTRNPSKQIFSSCELMNSISRSACS